MEACKGKLRRLVGREEEIQLIIETLCRRTKRNPILVGPAGSGKTAIIEGLANKIVLGKVPKELRNVFVYELQPSVLVAMAAEDGGLEKVIKEMLAEASQPDVILFFDEVHTIIGSGGLPGTTDIASMLKPPLARGDIACIAATTEDEYYRFIEPDPALARRFQPIRVQELSAEETLQVVSSLRDELRISRKVRVSDYVLRWLVYFAQQFIKNRHFPDKAVDLLEHGEITAEIAEIKEKQEKMGKMLRFLKREN
ncbi:MAG: AAA family ATPase [Pelotomaculaceae bacterium]|jgi:ATP-dependent Clp protease ATP-binding subunit ClpA|uniref:Chaperone protein ClpB n=1 Tax=anaerobic digester metagenome TaxID=1263854 RepID=A0A485M543_9ZZZZ|nr:AAA family ATPase [Bacillota bacterium]HHU87454.1 ATP-dependent Clp protease ATP-binding subunit [Peptococcaceae bacterium]